MCMRVSEIYCVRDAVILTILAVNMCSTVVGMILIKVNFCTDIPFLTYVR
jgi:hypothetical protein